MQHPSNHPNIQRLPHIPALACRHNVNYWRGGSFYGLGPSATGYVRGVRTKNWSNTQLYCEQLEKGKRAIESREELPPLKRAGETAAFGLRMNAGWPFEEFQRTTDFDLRDEWSAEMKQLVERGWAARDAQRFQLTLAGIALCRFGGGIVSALNCRPGDALPSAFRSGKIMRLAAAPPTQLRRQPDGEGGPGPRLARDFNRPAMRLDDGLGNRQAQAGLTG